MREKKKNLIVIFSVLVISFLVCIAVITVNFFKIKKENALYDNLEQYKIEKAEDEAINSEVENIEVENEADETIEEEIVEEYISEIDFESLQRDVNKDIYAWIRVEGTVIDYPVLQHDSDDSYYLTHNLDGSTGYPGCIYSEHYNHKTFEDRVTVLYGHNMRAGTMFADLHKFKDKSFFDDHDTIEVYLPKEKKVFKIVSAYYTNDRRITTYYKTMTDEGAANWIATLGEVVESDRDHVREVEYSNDDTFIVLETCVGKDKNHRLVVVGVLQQR